jgi:ribose transport system ATP-binding protein
VTAHAIESTVTDPAAPLLELRGVTKRFGQNAALDDVSLTVRPHEVVGLIGENGAGKSTLLKLLAGTHRPDEGQILFSGTPVTVGSPAAAAALGVGVVHQEQNLLSNLTVAENLMLGHGKKAGWGAVVRRARMERAAEVLLDTVKSAVSPRAMTGDLDFAQRQMVEIARALSNQRPGRPPLVILDEPTSVLEDEDVAILRDRVRALREIGSVIFVSHRLDEVLDFSDRVYVLRDGKLVGESDADAVQEADLYRLMVGRESAEGHYREDLRAPARAEEQAVLSVEGLTRRGRYQDVSFRVCPGEVVGLVGVVGSGREHLARALFGAEHWDDGKVLLDGRPVRWSSPTAAVHMGVAYVPAERRAEGMIAGATVAENLGLVHPRSLTPGRITRPGARAKAAMPWIERLGVRPPDPHADMGRLSGGNQQKIAVGRWLLDEDLRLLILDHPTRGVDMGAKEELYGQFRELCARGVAILLLADNLDEAIGLSDTVVVMADGEVTGTFGGLDPSAERPTPLQLLQKMM